MFGRSRASSSMVEQWTFNPLVLGSSPRGRTKNTSSGSVFVTMLFDSWAARGTFASRIEGAVFPQPLPQMRQSEVHVSVCRWHDQAGSDEP